MGDGCVCGWFRKEVINVSTFYTSTKEQLRDFLSGLASPDGPNFRYQDKKTELIFQVAAPDGDDSSLEEAKKAKICLLYGELYGRNFLPHQWVLWILPREGGLFSIRIVRPYEDRLCVGPLLDGMVIRPIKGLILNTIISAHYYTLRINAENVSR